RQLAIGSPEGMALARAEIRERHLVRATDFGVHVVHLAGESVRRQPFGQRVRIQKRPIDPLGRRTEHTMKPDRTCGHGYFSLLMIGCFLAERHREIKVAQSSMTRQQSSPEQSAEASTGRRERRLLLAARGATDLSLLLTSCGRVSGRNTSLAQGPRFPSRCR